MASKLIVLLFAVCLFGATFARYVNEHGNEQEKGQENGPEEPDFGVPAETAVMDANRVAFEILVGGAGQIIGLGHALGLIGNTVSGTICGQTCIVRRATQICKWQWTYKTDIWCDTAEAMFNCKGSRRSADVHAFSHVIDLLKGQGKCST